MTPTRPGVMGYDLESAACVVRVEAFPEIRRTAVVEAIRFGDGAEDVGVVHFTWGLGQPWGCATRPYFAAYFAEATKAKEATKGILRFRWPFSWPAIRSFRHGSEEWRMGWVALGCLVIY